jgi:hypothetical protein
MDRKFRADREDKRAARYLDHRRKRFDRIRGSLAIAGATRTELAAEHDRVTVRIGTRESTAADGPPAPARFSITTDWPKRGASLR